MGLALFFISHFEYYSSKLYIMPFLFDFKKVFGLSTGDFFKNMFGIFWDGREEGKVPPFILGYHL